MHIPTVRWHRDPILRPRSSKPHVQYVGLFSAAFFLIVISLIDIDIHATLAERCDCLAVAPKSLTASEPEIIQEW